MKKILLFLFIAAALFAGCKSESGGDGGGSEPSKSETAYPTFSPIGGFYKEAQTVTITCEDAAAIYYTTDLSKPTEESALYEAPFSVDKQCIIRAMAVKKDGSKNYAMTCFDFDLDRTTDFKGTVLDSPEWQDQVIYFILTDRFFNGDTSNDKIGNLTDQNGNPYDESQVLAGQPASGYNGGDLEGVRQKLDYIQKLGATAIWITPPIKNQVAEGNYHGYHGYWASDFTKVDEHQGTMEQYQALVDEAHKRGMYVIQDIVVNHTGDYQKITDNVAITEDMVKNSTLKDFQLNSYSVPSNHPEQLPWAFNDIKDLTSDEFKNNSFYNFNSKISNFSDSSQRYKWQSSDLDDINTENPVVRNLLRGYFRYWIDKTNIDGYRIDTVYYVEEDFFNGFINSTDSGNPGIRPYAATLGKNDFLNFGEAWSTDEKIVSGYTVDSSGNKLIDSIIYFPLRFAITDTISQGSKTSSISDILNNRYRNTARVHYDNPDRLVTFIDNHDTERFGKTMNGNDELVKAAYGLIFTIPGIPQIYYGTEQGFNGESRAGMFAGSFKAAGETQSEDKFDETSEWYSFFKNLTAMRKENRVFRYNTLYVLADTDDGAGLFSYIVREKDENGNVVTDGTKNKAIFVMNTDKDEKVLNASYANITGGDKFTLLSDVSACPTGNDNLPQNFIASETILANGTKRGNVHLIIPGYSYGIYLLTEVGAEIPGADHIVTLDEVPTEEISGNEITIKGTSSNAGTVKIVLNGNYTNAEEVIVSAGSVQFDKNLDITALSNGTVSVQLILNSDDGYTTYSNIKTFTILRPFKLLETVCVADPTGDDNGVGVLKGKMQLPADETFNGQMDIQGVDVYRSGNDIRLGVKMKTLSRSWNPTSNLFDHVIFHIFISDGDDSTGCEYHSGYNYKLPNDFKWDFMYQSNGWGSGYYNCDGASETASGKAVTPAPANSPAVIWGDDETVSTMVPNWEGYTPGADWEDYQGMIWFTISAASLGYPSDITGYKIYINTYDFDMGAPRGMVEGNAEQWKFGTGDVPIASAPCVVDELDNIITIPAK